MATREGRKPFSMGLRGYVLSLAAAWAVIVAVSLAVNLYEEKLVTLEMARNHARTAHSKDVVYRRWATEHGGVYVPTGKTIEPNPHLENVSERDVETPSGRLLTLVNPSYMTRQAHKLEAEAFDVRGHITSLKPINNKNAPDAWEVGALLAFEAGKAEFSSIQRIDDADYMRLMRPLITEPSCVQCHSEEESYIVGEVRGGISVAVPMAPLWANSRKHIIALSLGHSLLYIVGLCGIGVGAGQVRKHLLKRQSAEQALKESEILLRTVADRNARLKAEQALLATQEQLRVAQEIQEKILPDSVPVVAGLDIGGMSHPAEATSGDYFDYIPMPDGCLGIVVADVSGHGIGPALLMAQTCAYLRALTRTSSDVGDIVTRLNAFLAEDTAEGRFVTLFFARFDPGDRSLVYASAGHESYVLQSATDVEVLEATGIPLGLIPGESIPTAGPITLQPGQILLLMTDGIAEVEAEDGVYFGTQRAFDLVWANRDEPAHEIADSLYQAARDFSDGGPQSDDMTALVVKVE